MDILLLLFGLVGLWFGTKLVIDGALGIAKRYNLSHSFVGIAILGVGTDLPEVFVTLKASLLQLQGIPSSGIITGNAIGSCFSQITLILGIAGLFLKFTMAKKDLVRDGLALIGSIVFLFIFGKDGTISRGEGLLMLLIYIVYYLFLIQSASNHGDDSSSGKDFSKRILAILLLGGLVVLVFSSHLVVSNAMIIASKWGVEQSFVGIVIIGIGTSLPELAVSVGAALKKSASLSVGNVIGSNIFDGLIPIGLGGVISTVTIQSNLLQFDLPLLLLYTVVVLYFLKTKRGISTFEGGILVALFFIYLAIKFFTL